MRSSALWPKTLLIITYDEYGGIYDHVEPPSAMPPEQLQQNQLLPLIATASVTVFGKTTAQPYDHTSIIATARKRLGLGAPLTARDANPPDLDDVLARPQPDNMQEATCSPPSSTVRHERKWPSHSKGPYVLSEAEDIDLK